MDSPVLLIIFNRPDITKKVFDKIAKAKPPKLFLVSDGPRPGNEMDRVKCAETKNIVENISWECDVYRNYSERNLGCGIRIASGLNWVFEHVDRAIILEDDCLPEQTFFRFCDELLERYKDDQRVMQINGSNFQAGRKRSGYSYYFSEFPLTWGWATWRRAWKYYDHQLHLWEELRKTEFPHAITRNKDATRYWRHQFEDAYRADQPNEMSSWDYTFAWDYQWTFAFWIQHGLSISPVNNQISNIGFGEASTHTKNADKEMHAFAETSPVQFPLEHPPHFLVNKRADKFFVDYVATKVRFLKKKKPSIMLKVRNSIAKRVRALKQAEKRARIN
ncbi:MAG: glycosyltransferase family 2 protein [Bacteroidetes bacterium]|jgi:hypothetical protein|nr:glycosyltransferase family 2 protein [Bacteroidota bacterium]